MSDDHVPSLSVLTENFLHDYFTFYPTTASTLGLHEYDGQVPDLSFSSIQSRIATLNQYQEQVKRLSPDNLDKLEFFDYLLLQWRIESELWEWKENVAYTYNPMFYADYMMVDGYVKRNYAPLETRATALIRHLQHIPAIVDTAQQNLIREIPRVLIEESLPIFDGLITFLEESLTFTFGGDTISAQQQQALKDAQDAASQAILKFKTYLQQELLPLSHDHFAIGAQRFSDMLKFNELIDIPLDKLLAIGEEDLARNQATLEEIVAKLDPNKTVQEHMQILGRDHPAADQLLDNTRALLDNLRTFVIEHHIVTVPESVSCIVEETPPFARWAFAMMDTAGPFEEMAKESFYYVTLPEAHWSPEKVEGWLTKFDNATMTGVSIHEAYPGHFVHFMNMHNAPTNMSQVFDTYSHYESWAHYSEQMMLDEGYGNGDLPLRMAQLSEALVRNCRYVCAIKMHTQGMSVEEATQFFITNAYMDRVTAEKEAQRGSHDPGYINYTLGKLLLLKLRDDYRAEQGEMFSLKKFHDEYIGYGSPPIPILRKMLVSNHNRELL